VPTKSVYNYVPIFKKSVLKNGIRVVTESHPHSRAVAVGIFVDLGSRDENPQNSGITHFIEHMVFKGTKKRSAFDISKSMEAVGGDLNAYTTRETTCFHATSLREHFPLALDVLVDLVRQARMTDRDFGREKKVIIQEIDMAKDAPDEYGGELYFEKVYGDHPIGAGIAGTEESLDKISRRDLVQFYRAHYGGSRLIVSVAGAVDHDEIVEQVEKALGKIPRGKKAPKRQKPRYRGFSHFQHRASEQVHLFMGLPSSSYKDPRRFDSYIVNALLGGGMTSRLYQRVREKRGLVYSIYSYLQSFLDCGVLMTYAGTSPENCGDVVEIVMEETDKLIKKPPGKKEIEMYRTQLEGQILLGSEDMENRMNSLGINELVFEQYRPVEKVISEIHAVNEDSVREYLHRYMRGQKFSFLGVGDLDAEQTHALLAKVKSSR
jgi:predicted Zn-dependent peptidase